MSYSIFFFFFYCSGHHRDLHSFPTRRSSDLACGCPCRPARDRQTLHRRRRAEHAHQLHLQRSEEHTSELQSLRHLVCRLLLEKKKKRTKEKSEGDQATHIRMTNKRHLSTDAC